MYIIAQIHFAKCIYCSALMFYEICVEVGQPCLSNLSEVQILQVLIFSRMLCDVIQLGTNDGMCIYA